MVSTTTAKIQYNCSGGTTYAFTFGVAATSELQVILTDANNVETILAETTNYTVSATNSDYTSGGTVTTVATYSSGYKLLIMRNIPIKQESDFEEAMPTLYETFEDALDNLTRIAQDNNDKISRAPLLPKSSTIANPVLPLPGTGAYIGWNSAGTALENKVASTITLGELAVIGDYSDSLATAIATIGTTPKLLLINKNITVSADAIVPKTLVISPTKDGIITVATGVTLTINSAFDPGIYQVFNCVGTGKVLFGPGAVKKIYSEWWGAVADDPTYATINYAAITAAIVSLGYYGIVRFNDGIYYTDDTVAITDTQADQKEIILEGNGRLNSLIYHIGAQTTGCIKISADATFAITYYNSNGHGRSHLEHIAVGSISGPGLHRYFTGGHLDKCINILGAGTTSSLMLLESCIEFYYDDVISWAWVTPWIDQIHSTGLYPAYAVTHPYNFIKIQDGTYNDGSNGDAPGMCHEGWFDNIRDNGSSHTREALYIVSDTVGQGDGGNFTFSGCKFTGPTEVSGYGAIRVDGMNRGVAFTNGTYVEAQTGIGATQGNIIINNDTDITKVSFSDSQWTGFLDIGEFGGSGTYKMHVSITNCRGSKLRINDASDTSFLYMVGNKFLNYPTTLYSALGSIAYPVIHDNVYEIDESTFYPITSESIVVGGKAQITSEGIATLSGAGKVITLGIPAGAKIHGAQFRVDTLITSGDGGTSWSGAFHGGSTTALVSGQAFTKNTKASALIVDEITTNTTNIAITANSGSFSGGVMRAVAYYEKILPMYDAP